MKFFETPNNSHKRTASTNQPTNQHVSNESLSHALKILTAEAEQFTYEIKKILCNELKLNISPHNHPESDFGNVDDQIKMAAILLNKDLKKILSLIKILLINKSNNAEKFQDNNQDKILKSCMLVKQLGLNLKDIGFDKFQGYNVGMLNLISIFNSLQDNLFSLHVSSEEVKQIMIQIKSKVPNINDKRYSHCRKQTNYTEASEVLQQYKSELQTLKNNYNNDLYLYQQQLDRLNQQNSNLNCYIQQNQKEYTFYIKVNHLPLQTYNELIDKNKRTIEQQVHKIQQLEKDKVILRQYNVNLRKTNKIHEKQLMQFRKSILAKRPAQQTRLT